MKQIATYSFDTWNYSRPPFARIIYEPPKGYTLICHDHVSRFSGTTMPDNWFRGKSSDPKDNHLHLRKDSLDNIQEISEKDVKSYL
jgi:hypothetical protein